MERGIVGSGCEGGGPISTGLYGVTSRVMSRNLNILIALLCARPAIAIEQFLAAQFSHLEEHDLLDCTSVKVRRRFGVKSHHCLISDYYRFLTENGGDSSPRNIWWPSGGQRDVTSFPS
jgi:hypothetical protein